MLTNTVLVIILDFFYEEPGVVRQLAKYRMRSAANTYRCTCTTGFTACGNANECFPGTMLACGMI